MIGGAQRQTLKAPFVLLQKKKTTGNSTSTQKELHCRERNERPRQQASFDTNKCANVTAPDGTNECITASQPSFTSTVRCSRNEHNASIELNDDGGKGREEREGGIFVHLWGHLPDDTLYQSLSPRWWENAIFSIFCMMTPICRLHLPSLLTQAGQKRKPRVQVLILSISSIPFSQIGGGGRRRWWNGLLFTVASSILMVYPSTAGLAATTVSTLVPGCEEAACYLLFADRYTQRCWREREEVWRPIYRGAAIIKECFLWF